MVVTDPHEFFEVTSQQAIYNKVYTYFNGVFYKPNFSC